MRAALRGQLLRPLPLEELGEPAFLRCRVEVPPILDAEQDLGAIHEGPGAGSDPGRVYARSGLVSR
ncbi:hypothetical protein [Sorangium sp. So ce388]|uniref:hypothetical protein n=1 Tax=Sorangium sp. So ce388 TaxID=3133309 RepID=UPI003F5BCA87